MSDYVRKKVIRLPYQKSIIDTFEDKHDGDEYERFIESKVGDLFKSWGKKQDKYFEVEFTDNGIYIDWVYFSTYGEDSGDYGIINMLTDNEFNQIKAHFDLLQIEYTRDQLRKIDYSYYNGCECTDYYDIKKEDEILV